MDKQHFDQLVKGVREMKRQMAGKNVRGARTTDPIVPDVRTIREAVRTESARTLRGSSQFVRRRRSKHPLTISVAALPGSGTITKPVSVSLKTVP